MIQIIDNYYQLSGKILSISLYCLLLQLQHDCELFINPGAMVSTATPPLSTNVMQRTFRRSDVIPLQANFLLRIERGVVRTSTWSEEGIAAVLGYWGVGDVVGQPLSTIQPYQIECLTVVETSYIPAPEWKQVLDDILRHVQQTEELLCIAHNSSIRERLLKLLIWLARKFARKVEQGQLIDLRLTHQEISEILGTTRVTVTRLLSQFEQEGIIHRPHRHCIVLHSSH